jgi:Pentapeptide repeats (8 copies)
LAWTAGVIAAAVVAVAVGYVVFWRVSDLIAGHDVGAITGQGQAAALRKARDAARGRLLAFGAGLFAAGALVYTARTYYLSRQTQVTDRYTKAIEQFGSKELDVRIGVIYALERIARDSPRDHPTIMEVLATFVRDHSPEQWPLPTAYEPGAEPPGRTTRPDVQATVTVIGRRNPRHDRHPINLSGADLTSAGLPAAYLKGANLTGAHLPGANL